MKKIYQIIMLCAMSIALAGCSGENYSANESAYKEACEQGDFIKAYDIVDGIKKEADKHLANSNGMDDRDEAMAFDVAYSKYKEAEYYVVLHEAIYVLENQGIDGLVKIALLVKEHDADWLYKELLDVVKAMNNKELEKKLKVLAGLETEESDEITE